MRETNVAVRHQQQPRDGPPRQRPAPPLPVESRSAESCNRPIVAEFLFSRVEQPRTRKSAIGDNEGVVVRHVEGKAHQSRFQEVNGILRDLALPASDINAVLNPHLDDRGVIVRQRAVAPHVKMREQLREIEGCSASCRSRCARSSWAP